jgi:hypothetical protein
MSDPFFDDEITREMRRAAKPKPEMTELGKEIAARFKEIFYAYQWRDTGDNRAAQDTVGPSEVGTPCDRRLAMSLMRIPPVHAGGEGWAAFVGTCVHAGLAEMFLWASGRSGRFAVELPLRFDSLHMPRGTGDLLDKVMFLFVDHKVMGKWSTTQLKTKGPSSTYRVQVHLYAHAARMQGHTVENVAIVGWPREGNSLDDLWVWTEPFSPGIVKDSLDRLDRITGQIALSRGEEETDLQIAKKFEAADDCRYCRFHIKGDDSFTQGCPGR